ncbi:LytR/AlgR family response regulator transcription factor [Saccharicrinis fermentans]|uniref:Response regulator of the LytR/AlgR family protein n=1 Tax=Saccharicrinis fermentans DSM 9555 = JCM 21142 TaxID=869213 RepID=W7XUP8_9BACT|nr:LytTR family DNA-binding domain-containing protein [Saccharicrinis fermentans]GAF01760.1 response regulator of the LytR/AlgR family protein [Saccharicrinis fermentans DSM 9555 = JCM 21142]
MNKVYSTFYGKILRFLSRPYTYNYHGRNLWRMAALLFILASLFNYLFQPFTVYLPEHKINYLWISLIHACVPFCVISFLPFCILRFKAQNNWNVRKELLLITLFLLLVGVFQFLIRDMIYDNANNWSWRYLYEEIRNTFLTGVLLTLLLAAINYNIFHHKSCFNHEVLDISGNAIDITNNKHVFIKTRVKSEAFKLDLDRFLFAKADGNYVELYLNEQEGKKIVKRISLTELSTTLVQYPNIMRTHRSYLVNLCYLKSREGNAQGYKIKLHHYPKKIPVSRKMMQEFNQRIKDVEVLCHSSQKLAIGTKIDG